MKINTIFKNLLPIKDEYIVVGVSAGPDSIALLHMLQNNQNKKIVCAHVNHNVRKESEEEEKYLKKYCQENNLLFEVMKIKKYTENNFENEARKKRYKFYEKILKKYNSHTLFLAHHGDDLIETVLMKIIRGSNLEGYAGIKEYSYLDKYTIIRPLIRLTKQEIITYNKENNLKYYLDKTNEDITYTRNRIRKKITPLLKEEDNNIHLKFLKYSNTLEEYYNYIEYLTKEKMKKIIKDNIINNDLLKKEHPFMKKNIVFYLLREIYNNKSNIIKDKHIEGIIKISNSNKPNQFINLPNKYIAKKEYNKIIIEKKEKNNIREDYKIELKDYLKINGFTIEKVSKIDTDGNDVCRLNSNNINLPLYIRNKKEGDYIEINNLGNKKKLKEIFIENKIPKDKRNSYPILVDNNDNILWIPNIKKSKYNVKKDELCDIILISHTEREDINENKN